MIQTTGQIIESVISNCLTRLLAVDSVSHYLAGSSFGWLYPQGRMFMKMRVTSPVINFRVWNFLAHYYLVTQLCNATMSLVIVTIVAITFMYFLLIMYFFISVYAHNYPTINSCTACVTDLSSLMLWCEIWINNLSVMSPKLCHQPLYVLLIL